MLVTKSLLGLLIGTCAVSFFTGPTLGDWLGTYLGFSTATALRQPWTLVTYAILAYDPFSVLWAGLWLWFIAGDLERTWGSRKFFYFWLAMSGLAAAGLWVGALLLQPGVPLTLRGVWLPLSAVTVAWATLHPDALIHLYFVLPIKAKYIAWFDAAAVLFLYGSAYGRLMGFFALLSLAVAWAYADNERTGRWHWRWFHFRRTRRRRQDEDWERRFKLLMGGPEALSEEEEE